MSISVKLPEDLRKPIVVAASEAMNCTIAFSE